MKAILVINSGSSSLKFGLFLRQSGNPGQSEDERPLVKGGAEGIGKSMGRLEILDSSGAILYAEDRAFASQTEALDRIAKQLTRLEQPAPVAIGHRMVHGGPNLVEHQEITPEVLGTLRRSVHFAPLHIPAALELVLHTGMLYPHVPQFACFDTAFHKTLPEIAFRFPIPDRFSAEGVRRYGFHGLSYASIVHTLGKQLPKRTVIAHLGSGSSLAALKDGESVDTSMGLTPAGGVPMGTRTGDLDPGVLLFLMRTQKLDAAGLESLLNNESGLSALGGSNDMRELEASAAKGGDKAQIAIDIFCRSIAKTVAAFATVLDGLDLLVFTGGIGEHSHLVRANVCGRLGFLGVEIDATRNALSVPVISTGVSQWAVRVAQSEEEKQIARYVRRLLTA